MGVGRTTEWRTYHSVRRGTKKHLFVDIEAVSACLLVPRAKTTREQGSHRRCQICASFARKNGIPLNA